MAVGFKVADAYVEIHTEDDTRKGRQKIDRDTTRWSRGLGMRLGRVIGAGLLMGIGRAILKALALIGKLALLGIVAGTVATAIGGLASAIAGLIPVISTLISTAVAASGTLLLIPAAIAGLIATVATAKLGLKGMGEALKAVGSGDAAVLNEALKKLAPNARAFVREIARIKPIFDRMRLRIQNTLFAGLARSMRELARLTLPILNDRLKEMAGVLNGAIRDVIEFLISRQTRLDLDNILNAAARAADNLRKGLVPILSILRDITAVGLQVFAELTAGFGRTLEGWAADIARLREEGGLREMIMEGLAAAKLLGGLLLDLLGIIRSIARAAGDAGGLFAFFDRINKLLQGDEAQKSMREFFGALADIGKALVPVLLALLKALVPVAEGIAMIAQAFGPALTVLLLALGNALKLLAEPIAGLAPLIFELARGLAPVAVILGELVKAATPGLTVFLAALVDALIALVPVAPIVGKALGDLFAALAPVLEALGPTLAVILTTVATALSAIARAATPVIKVFAEGLGKVMERILPVLIELAEQVLPIFADMGLRLAEAFAPLVPVMMELLEAWLDAMLPHLPAFIEMLKAMADVVVTLGAVFAESLLIAMKEIVPLLPDLFAAVADLSRAFHELFAALRPVVEAFIPANKEAGEAERRNILIRLALLNLIVVLKIAAGIIGGIASVIASFTGGVARARNGIESFGRAVAERIGAAMGFFKNLGKTIANAVGNLGSTLYNAGKSLIEGLWNGIRSMGSWLWGKVYQFMVDNLPGPVKRALGIGSPSKVFAGFGRDTVRGFWKGVNEEADRTRRSILSMLPGPPPLPAFAGFPNGGGQPAGGGGGRPPTFGPYVLELDGKAVAEFAIDAVTGAPQTVAATAAEGDRQRRFVSSSRNRR